MRAIDRKLYRDLIRLRSQVISIAVVVACGIAAYVALNASFRSVRYSQLQYYDRYRFADLFCRLKRAPSAIVPRLEEIEGVAMVYPRLVESVMVPMPGMQEPAFGEIVSLPKDGAAPLNGIHLRAGRIFAPGRSDEVVLLEAFAEAHHLVPGDSLRAVINGKLRTLRIVGVAMSPEYVFGAAPGDLFGDAKRFAVLWMDHEVVAAAFAMQGAFDAVAMTLQPGASAAAVRDRVDRLLKPYGAQGVIDREHHTSHHMLDMELTGIESMSTRVPILFLGVAAFLLNVVLARLVQLQRSQIATLKAIGYRAREIGLHYLELVSVVVLLGAAAGLALGAWMGHGMMGMLAPYFHFPSLSLRLDADLLIESALVSLLAAVIGGLATVRGIAKMAPAEAMRPPAPATYKRSLFERLGADALLGTSGLMVVRELSRRPMRLAISSLGIALGVGILVAGRANFDSITYFMDLQFSSTQRQDATVTFADPIPLRAVRSLAKLPGVLAVESARTAPVRFRRGAIYRDSTLTGHHGEEDLQRLLDREGRLVPIPIQGLVLDAKLAEVLNARVGDRVEVESLLGEHRTQEMMVVATMQGPLGLMGYIRDAELDRFVDEEQLRSTAFLRIDAAHADEAYASLQALPHVIGVAKKESALEQFRIAVGNSIVMMVVILTLFAGAITIGVVYNNARVSLSQRATELGSLRVLGYTRAEVSMVLLGEMAVQVLLALPVGLWLGRQMALGLASARDAESFRLPVVISSQTFAFAVLIVVVTSAISALIVRRRVDRFDLVAVLKTRE